MSARPPSHGPVSRAARALPPTDPDRREAGPGTQVTVAFDPEGPGTRLTLRHGNLPSAELQAGHQVAWDTYLPRLVILVAGGDPGADPHA